MLYIVNDSCMVAVIHDNVLAYMLLIWILCNNIYIMWVYAYSFVKTLHISHLHVLCIVVCSVYFYRVSVVICDKCDYVDFIFSTSTSSVVTVVIIICIL